MGFVDKIKSNSIVVSARLFAELVYDYKRLLRNLGAIDIESDREKFHANLLIAIHSIEKGLALPNPRRGFGVTKVGDLLSRMAKYKKKYGYDDLFIFAKPIFESYFAFNGDAIDAKLLNKFLQIYSGFPHDKNTRGGITRLSKNDVLAKSKLDFESFCHSRYSIRDFSDQEIDLSVIYKAMEIASKSPSACNRQPWRVYVFTDKKLKEDLLKWQLGNNGFSDKINKVILVTCNLKSYFINESHQAYVDGGLYSMSLIYAFHALGIGSIALTTAMMSTKTQLLYTQFGVPDNEVPILMIGLGHLKSEFNVAVSERIGISDYLIIK